MNNYTPVKNLKDLIQSFSDEAKCRQFLVQQRWNGCPECPYCGTDKYYVIENGKRFKCANKACYKKYSVTVGTIFHSSNIPLTTWFPAVYLITAHKKGISSIQLSKDLGVTQKTAWFMLHRVRQSLQDDGTLLLKNVVEIDEVYIGGKFKNMSNKKRKKFGEEENKNINKVTVIGMLERKGNLKLVVAGKGDARENIPKIVNENVDKTSILMTDGEGSYRLLTDSYAGHETVNHTMHEYVRNGTIYTNSIEGAFSLLKRSIIGIYHQISPKHLFRYCDETAYRYNTRDLKDGQRFEYSLTKVTGKLGYKELIKKTDLTSQTIIKPPLPPIIFNGHGWGKPVYQIKNNKVIAQFPSLIEAQKVTGISRDAISKVVRGLRKSCGGYQWKFA